MTTLFIASRDDNHYGNFTEIRKPKSRFYDLTLDTSFR